MERYPLNFGRSNAGAPASFTTFVRLDTLVALTQPAITEIGDGWFYFEYDASLAPVGVTQFAYTAICGTGEVYAVETVAAAAGAAGSPGATGTGIAAAAPVPYELFFGVSLAGNSPTWVRFARADTHAAITAPSITEIGDGLYQFIVDWRSQPATSIEYVVSCAGVELADVIEGSPAPGSIAVATGSTNFNGYATLAAILNRVAVQCGLSTVADPYASTNADFILLRELLNSAARDILDAHEWTHLVRLASLVTDGSTTSYTLPYDHQEMVPRTLYDRTSSFEGIGPLSFPQAACLQAQLATLVVNVAYQIQGGLLTFPVVPPSGATVAWYYVSNYWIKSSGGSAPDRSTPVAADDVLLLPEELLVLGVKLRFLEERGFDTTITRSRYDQKLEHAIGANMGGGQVLSLTSGSGWDGNRPLDYRNIPDGSWTG